METKFLGNKKPHINHWNCTPVYILEQQDDLVLVSPMTVGPTWNERWVALSSLHGVHLDKSLPHNRPTDKGGQSTDLGRHVIVSGGEVLEL